MSLNQNNMLRGSEPEKDQKEIPQPVVGVVSETRSGRPTNRGHTGTGALLGFSAHAQKANKWSPRYGVPPSNTICRLAKMPTMTPPRRVL